MFLNGTNSKHCRSVTDSKHDGSLPVKPSLTGRDRVKPPNAAFGFFWDHVALGSRYREI